MERAIVCGAGGFIAGHLVKRLKQEGCWVRGVDLKRPEFGPTAADDFRLLDLREPHACEAALALDSGAFDVVYQLAADMGGMGFIHSAECEIMRNNALINLNMIDAAARKGIKRYFFSSSVCIYRDMQPGEPELKEAEAYPALPDNEYGREKAPAAICRKVTEGIDGGTIEMSGDAKSIRSYRYNDVLLDGVYRVTRSSLDGPAT